MSFHSPTRTAQAHAGLAVLMGEILTGFLYIFQITIRCFIMWNFIAQQQGFFICLADVNDAGGGLVLV
ncbi:hypothetical protein V8J88_17620 [Massilia sp. W12]|uniref:hypothetical protein n=1 Tax=Massilia sp. W12 TaxID=3126507 RepID=UPI0030CF6DB0